MIFVVGNECVLPSDLPPQLAAPCQKLAEFADTTLLGIGFVRQEDAWLMNGATPVPDLSLGGARLADALARALA